jgi:hypothetical protein
MDRLARLQLRRVHPHGVGNHRRQALDLHLAQPVLEHAALFDTQRRIADQLDVHIQANRAVERHLEQVDVQRLAGDRIVLHLAENR